MTPTTLYRAADPAILKRLAKTSGAFLLALFDSSPDCIQLIELDGTLAYMNPNGQCAMGISDFDTVSGQSYVTLWPEENRVRVSLSLAAAKAGQSSRIEAFIPAGDGSAHWWDLSISPVKNASGKVVRILSIARDVTAIVERRRGSRDDDRKLTDLNRSLTEELALKDILAREIDHRVKNSLATVAAILRLQSRNAHSEEAKQKLTSAAARVSTVARVHQDLQLAADITHVSLQKYLPAIATDVTEALAREDVTLSIFVEDIDVTSEVAISLGMICAELVSNAFKHAFGDHGGTVALDFRRVDDQTLRMIVRDNGEGGCVVTDMAGTSDRAVGLGTRIVQLQVAQIRGTLDCISPKGGGTVFTVDFPA